MADKKTSAENTLTKSGFTANTIMRLADGSTSDNYKTPVLDFINAITLTSAQAITLLGTPSDVVLDSMYKITTLSITGVTEVIISGRNMIQGNSPAQCLVTGIGRYVPCTYDVASNKISCTYVLWSALMNYGPTISVTKLITNNSGETPTLSNDVDGVLNVIFTGGKLISETNAFKYVTAFYAGSDLFTAIGRYLDTNTFEVTLTRISDNAIRNPGADVLVKLEIEINISNL